MEMLYFTFLLLFLIGCADGMSEPNIHDPVIQSKFHNRRGKPVFYGVIREDETTVRLNPPLKATDEDTLGGARFICEYEVVRSRRRGKNPFVFEMTNKTTGEASIRVRENVKLNFEKRARYKLYIVAKDCGGIPRLSDPAIVMIEVKDVDEFAPVFENSSYFAKVEEGKIFNNIITLKAKDADRSPTYKGICDYEILTPDVPFTINKKGELSNTEPLDYSIHRNYILKVVARDCGKKKSKPVFVNILVQETCHSGWQDVQEKISYLAGSGRQKIAENAHLRLCEANCTPERVDVRMTLATKHIGKGCDRDTYSITSQRKLCGASGDSVDLLPSPSLASWTKNLPRDDGHESDQFFAFDGEKTAVEVPKDYFNHSLNEHFTISTWMKHDFPDTHSAPNQHSAPKEHILCMSDGDHMSRHHYSFFVHGEKLVFLLRREAMSPKEMEIFKPAEWRWHIPQINDAEWHHYAVSIDFPEVKLYIDGKQLIPDESNLEIMDDWPVHRSSKVHSTKLVVGACWQGLENKFGHFFKGYLAGLSILKDKTESGRVIKCLNNCKENLDFHAQGDMQSGTSVSFNSEMTEFSITGKEVTEVEKLMREVAYVNARIDPTPGRRNLRIETSVRCDGQAVLLPLIESYIMVQEQPKPIITVSGSTNLTRLAYEYEHGLRIFNDVQIFATREEEEEDDDDISSEDKANKLAQKLSKTMTEQMTETKDNVLDEILLDSCDITANPPLNLFYEHLSLPTHMMENVGLEWSETNDGVVITNADKIDRYVSVIRNIHYYHNQPEILNSRTLTLSCSSQNERFISNKFVVKLVALHQVPQAQHHANVQQETVVSNTVEKNHLKKLDAKAVDTPGASSNLGMAAIIVVCVGFLLFMIILGVIRIRAAHRRTQVVHVEEKQEMEWDNSGLNITVNPMEQEIFEYEDNAMQSLRDDTDSDDDGSSFHDDGDSSDEEPREPLKGTDLEWDHSNLSF